MVSIRIASTLLVVNAVIGVLGVSAFGTPSSEQVRRPSWLPSVWMRAAFTVTVAGGLWLAQPWAWWLAIVVSAAMLLWTGLASVMLALGGFFQGAAMLRAVYIGGLAATWAGVLAALLV